MTEAKKIKNSFLYMFNGEPIADFLKECEISIVKTERSIKIPTFAITFRVPAPTYKKYEHHHDFFQGKLKQGLHQFHQYDSVLVYLTADWDKLEMVSTEVKPVFTLGRKSTRCKITYFLKFIPVAFQSPFRM